MAATKTGLSRRSVLAAAPVLGAAAPLKVYKRPFLIGTAGASYQIEGGNYASDCWVLEHVKPTIFSQPSGDGDDTYHRVEEDLALCQAQGFNAHRLSIEWSRIEPEQGQISKAGLAYYRRVLESCRRRGLAPVVTYSHWTNPRWFAEKGGFDTPEAVKPFVDYCTTVTRALGDLMETAATFNEANIAAQIAWAPGISAAQPIIAAMGKAAAARSPTGKFGTLFTSDWRLQQPNFLEAHARAYDTIKAVRADLPVGVTLALSDDQATGPGSLLERKIAEVWAPWMGVNADWIGVQTYSRALIGPDGAVQPPKGSELTEAGYEVWPQALEATVRRAAAMAKKPIYVTENGIGTSDDTRRVAYIRDALAGLKRAMADGIDVRGYLPWSLLDNWEWPSGYKTHFGLVAVDRDTFKRTPKPSLSYLGKVARAWPRAV